MMKELGLIFFVFVQAINSHVIERESEDEITTSSPYVPPPISIPPIGNFNVLPSGLGQCPEKPKGIKLDIEKFVGAWYQVAGSPSFFLPSGTKCIRSVYNQTGNNTISILNTNTNPAIGFSESCGKATVLDSEYPGELLIEFPFIPNGSNMFVLETDYDHFATIYSCKDFPIIGKFEYTWVMSRDPNPSDDLIEKGKSIFADRGFDPSNIAKILHDDSCVYSKPDGNSCANSN